MFGWLRRLFAGTPEDDSELGPPRPVTAPAAGMGQGTATVRLTAVGPDEDAVAGVVASFTGVDRDAAAAVVARTPATVRDGLAAPLAAAIADRLRDAGAEVEVVAEQSSPQESRP